MPQWSQYITEPRNFSPAEFVTPDVFFGPAYSWVWNAPVTEEVIRRQIDEMALAGIQVFYIIPEPPEFRPETMITYMTPDYLSPEFFRMVRLAVEYGRSKGMIVWIYDEGGWPSGNACGQVVRTRPDLAGKRIDRRTLELKTGEAYVPGKHAVSAFLDKQRIAAGAVFQEDVVICEYYRTVLDHGAVSQKSPILPDLLEPDTIPVFIQLTHERYYEALGDLADAVIPFVFIDEPHMPMPAFPWDFPERFLQTYGYSIEDFIYVLLEKENLTPQESQARQDYASLIGQLYVERMMLPIRTWCREHGMIFTGHLDRDHSLDTFRDLYGNPITMMRKLDMPGIDVIWRQIYPAERPVVEGDSFFPRIASSVASQNGHLLSLSESFGVYSENIPPETMRWVCNYQFVRGIQVMNPMVIPYGREESLCYSERPSFCREMPGFTHLTQWNRQMRRISYFMSCGLPTTDCALYLPSDQLWKDAAESNAVIQAYHDLGEALEASGVTFDLIDREGILQGQIKNGALEIGIAAYRKIYVPQGVILPQDVAEKISRLDGNTVTWASADHPALMLRTRRDAAGNLLTMVFCQSLTPVTGTVTLNTQMACWQADAADGLMKPLAPASNGPQQLTLTLEPGQELLILAAETAVPAVEPGTLATTRQAKLKRCLQIMEFKLTYQGFTRNESVKEFTPAQDFASMVGEDFSGEIAYEFTLDLQPEDLTGTPVLVLDTVEHSARVLINGQFAGYMALKPYRLTLDAAMFRPGENRITLEVANTASNVFAVTDPYQWFDRAHVGPYHDREHQMEIERKDGGLYGPVTVEFYR